MASAMRLVVLFLAFASFLQPIRTVAQFVANTESSSSLPRLRARTISGTVTRDGKRIDGAVLTLHKFLGAYSTWPSHAAPEVFGETITTKDGEFRFDELPSGQYVVLVSGESIEVDLVKPKHGENDTVAIEDSAYSCVRATIISADGKKLKVGSPPPCW